MEKIDLRRSAMWPKKTRYRFSEKLVMVVALVLGIIGIVSGLAINVFWGMENLGFVVYFGVIGSAYLIFFITVDRRDNRVRKREVWAFECLADAIDRLGSRDAEYTKADLLEICAENIRFLEE